MQNIPMELLRTFVKAIECGSFTKAAEMMGISRRTLHRKLLQWPELDTLAEG